MMKMTKRFTYEYDDYNGNLFDNNHNTFYHIEDSEENISILCNRLNKIVDENEQLRKLTNIKNTNAKDLVDVLNDQEQAKWEKQKHIVHLEHKIHRMREQIKKLEYLYHYRTCEIERLNESEIDSYKREITTLEKENEQLKQQLTSILKLTKKIEDYTHDIKLIGDVE